ncbi:MAG: slipin family protein [Methanocellales archaeon]|nr:slipin family protein [Methanocellales archaeon]MDD3290978.1 slipin family protein [Methanocellales archaeon]MDD5234863.1 slipin family protein [Methanocellales archaeon]MDD5484767.1 slipin family protein [Methanocellales archaeon]
MNISLLVGTFVAVAILVLAVKIVRQYERAVIFRFGKLLGEKGPGIFVIIPFVDRLVKVDLRVRELDVPRQTIISRDNVSLDVDAVIYYKVRDSCKAIVEVEDYEAATSLLAQTTLRDVLGQNELDTILSERDKLNQKVQEILDAATDPWGMQVVVVTMRDVALPENMLRAIARQAEAEREKRARIILAEAEFQASERMNEAAALYEKRPIALKLREFQTLTEIAKEKNLIVISTGAGAVAPGEIGATAGLTKAFTER